MQLKLNSASFSFSGLVLVDFQPVSLNGSPAYAVTVWHKEAPVDIDFVQLDASTDWVPTVEKALEAVRAAAEKGEIGLDAYIL